MEGNLNELIAKLKRDFSQEKFWYESWLEGSKKAKGAEKDYFEEMLARVRKSMEFKKQNIEKAEKLNDEYVKILDKYAGAKFNHHDECIPCGQSLTLHGEVIESEKFFIAQFDYIGKSLYDGFKLVIRRCNNCQAINYRKYYFKVEQLLLRAAEEMLSRESEG